MNMPKDQMPKSYKDLKVPTEPVAPCGTSNCDGKKCKAEPVVGVDYGYDKVPEKKAEKECTPFCTNEHCSPDCVKATEKPVEICGLPVLEGANAICANSKPCERHTENPIEDTVSVVISGSYLIPKIPKRATRKVLKN